MYIVKYKKSSKTGCGKPYTLPFQNLSQANTFIKTCIKNNWLILGFTKEEIDINF